MRGLASQNQHVHMMPGMQSGSAQFTTPRESMQSPLAKKLFQIDGVTNVFFGSDFVTVTKSEDYTWNVIKPDIFAGIMDHFTSGMCCWWCHTQQSARICSGMTSRDAQIISLYSIPFNHVTPISVLATVIPELKCLETKIAVLSNFAAQHPRLRETSLQSLSASSPDTTFL